MKTYAELIRDSKYKKLEIKSFNDNKLGLSSMATGIGSGFSAFMSAIFLNTSGDTTTLSVTGGIIVVFAAIALAIGLGRLCANYLFGLGK